MLYSITCDIEKLASDKCEPLIDDNISLLVDPIKFVVDLPGHRNVVYVAVVSQAKDLLFLHEVYQEQKGVCRATFDIVQPQRYVYICLNIIL